MKHPILTEFSQIIREKMPDCLQFLVHFNCDEGPYGDELAQINCIFDTIECKLNKTPPDDQVSLSSLKDQLMELLPRIEIVYQGVIKTVSEEELAEYKRCLREWEKKLSK